MKQNSEVAAIKTESVLDYSDRESHSSSGEETESSVSNVRRRPRALSSVRHRSDDNLPRQNEQKPATSSGFLHPNGHAASGTTSDRQPRTTLQPEPDERFYRREPSRTRNTTPPRNTNTNSTPAPVSFPPADPNTPLGKLQALSSNFRSQWLPPCRKYIANPPTDLQTRTKEYRKLSESVLTQVTLKADAIEVEGNADARAFRRSLINEVNDMLKRLDAVPRS